MKISILGAGSIGTTLAQRLSAAGHEVRIANSRGPDTIPAEVLVTGAQAVHARDLADGAEVLISSVPLGRTPDVKPLIADLSDDAVMIDTSNYYPMRDGVIQALEDGQLESLWVVEQLGRPVVKAWNAITTGSFNTKSSAAGSPGRIAIPVAADSGTDRALAMRLVEETGFDAFDSGPLAESWRQQPGTPAYCTDLTSDEMPGALAAAKASRSPRRRDLAITVISELMGGDSGRWRWDLVVQVNRLVYN